MFMLSTCCMVRYKFDTEDQNKCMNMKISTYYPLGHPNLLKLTSDCAAVWQIRYENHWKLLDIN